MNRKAYSQNIVESVMFVWGWRLCDLFNDGNLMGSLTKNTG